MTIGVVLLAYAACAGTLGSRVLSQAALLAVSAGLALPNGLAADCHHRLGR
jgi:hypothetical protein